MPLMMKKSLTCQRFALSFFLSITVFIGSNTKFLSSSGELQHILYRQKEQFSDGVGYSWIDGLKDHANKHVRYIYFLRQFFFDKNVETF